jgi:hypothetical protein
VRAPPHGRKRRIGGFIGALSWCSHRGRLQAKSPGHSEKEVMLLEKLEGESLFVQSRLLVIQLSSSAITATFNSIDCVDTKGERI